MINSFAGERGKTTYEHIFGELTAITRKVPLYSTSRWPTHIHQSDQKMPLGCPVTPQGSKLPSSPPWIAETLGSAKCQDGMRRSFLKHRQDPLLLIPFAPVAFLRRALIKRPLHQAKKSGNRTRPTLGSPNLPTIRRRKFTVFLIPTQARSYTLLVRTSSSSVKGRRQCLFRTFISPWGLQTPLITLRTVISLLTSA